LKIKFKTKYLRGGRVKVEISTETSDSSEVN